MKTDTNLSLTALRYIVAVDTHRNFVRAAEACGVTQPTLSASPSRPSAQASAA